MCLHKQKKSKPLIILKDFCNSPDCKIALVNNSKLLDKYRDYYTI